MSLTNADVGTYPITWDGTTDAKHQGSRRQYTFTVTATSGGSTLTDATPCNWRPWPACRPAAAASN
jgi:flagellar basal-body rod modification protein FlgD